MATTLRIGVISALHQEQSGLIELMTDTCIHKYGMREYVTGNLNTIPCVFVISRIGKVAAAATVATLIERFQITHVVFTGVAGAADGSIKIGDVVVADSLIQHDMDASPLFPRFEIPLTGLSRFPSDVLLTNHAISAVEIFLFHHFASHISHADRSSFNLKQPRVHRGLIGSGDAFIDNSSTLLALKKEIPDLLAVEMEGAAVAQVCFEFGVPYVVIRTISDNANEDSPVDFMCFIDRIASVYAFHIIQRLCSLINP